MMLQQSTLEAQLQQQSAQVRPGASGAGSSEWGWAAASRGWLRRRAAA